MFCTINGAFSFGLRIFMMNVHEMEPHDTYRKYSICTPKMRFVKTPSNTTQG